MIYRDFAKRLIIYLDKKKTIIVGKRLTIEEYVSTQL